MQMDSATNQMYAALSEVERAQSHLRNREATGRIFAESLNHLVTVLSMVLGCVVIFVGLAQVWILRSFFTEKRHVATNKSNFR